MWWLFLIGLIVFEIVADVFVKEHSLRKTSATFVLALVFYIIANVCWLISMRYKSNLTISANIFSVATGVTAALVGYGFYKEPLSTQNMIGILFGLISLVLLFE